MLIVHELTLVAAPDLHSRFHLPVCWMILCHRASNVCLHGNSVPSAAQIEPERSPTDTEQMDRHWIDQ